MLPVGSCENGTMPELRYDLPVRPRRNRRNAAIRGLMRETELSPAHLILPLFVTGGEDVRIPIGAMPGCFRLSVDHTVALARQAWELGVRALALFPALPDSVKDPRATGSLNPNGLLQRTVRALKDALPDLVVITDVAMDPYSSDGHDGYLEDGQIINDVSLEILASMAVSQAQAGADYVAPSDMMDGRVGVLRRRRSTRKDSRIRASWPTPPSMRRASTDRPGGARFRAAFGRQEDLSNGPRQPARGASRSALGRC